MKIFPECRVPSEFLEVLFQNLNKRLWLYSQTPICRFREIESWIFSHRFICVGGEWRDRTLPKIAECRETENSIGKPVRIFGILFWMTRLAQNEVLQLERFDCIYAEIARMNRLDRHWIGWIMVARNQQVLLNVSKRRDDFSVVTFQAFTSQKTIQRYRSLTVNDICNLLGSSWSLRIAMMRFRETGEKLPRERQRSLENDSVECV